MTPLVAVALAGWALIFGFVAVVVTRDVLRYRRAGREWRAGQGQEDRP